MGYFGYGRGGLGLVLLTVVLTIVAGCGEKPSESPSDKPKSAFHFVLAASGLARDGLWKGTPLFADFNADGFLDLAAMVRLGDGPHIWLGNGRGEWNDVSKGTANVLIVRRWFSDRRCEQGWPSGSRRCGSLLRAVCVSG